MTTMKPTQVTFRGMPHSDAVETSILRKAEKLEAVYPGIVRCHVVVERAQNRHRHGNLYEVRVDVTVKGAELSADNDRGKDHAHEDVYVAIRDTFVAMRRRLLAHAEILRGQVKSHASPSEGAAA